MTTKPNGGPAFPQSIAAGPSGDVHSSDQWVDGAGMSLRDYAAIQFGAAMIGTSAAPALVGMQGAEPAVAEAAFRMADAFIAERGK